MFGLLLFALCLIPDGPPKPSTGLALASRVESFILDPIADGGNSNCPEPAGNIPTDPVIDEVELVVDSGSHDGIPCTSVSTAPSLSNSRYHHPLLNSRLPSIPYDVLRLRC